MKFEEFEEHEESKENVCIVTTLWKSKHEIILQEFVTKKVEEKGISVEFSAFWLCPFFLILFSYIPKKNKSKMDAVDFGKSEKKPHVIVKNKMAVLVWQVKNHVHSFISFQKHYNRKCHYKVFIKTFVR